MEMFCRQCDSAKKKFKIQMPVAVMVTYREQGFRLMDVTELRNAASCLEEARCLDCDSKLQFIHDEYAAHAASRAIDSLPDLELNRDYRVVEEPRLLEEPRVTERNPAPQVFNDEPVVPVRHEPIRVRGTYV